MKTYTVVIKIADSEDTLEDLLYFLQGEYRDMPVEVIYNDGTSYRCRITTDDYFDYSLFEDIMDSNNYPVEFISVETD